MKEFKSLLEDAEKLISYDADDQEARQGTSSWKTLAGKLWFTSHRKNHDVSEIKTIQTLDPQWS